MGYLLIKFIYQNILHQDTVNALKYSNEALLLKSTNVSRDILVALKQLSIIEPKKAAFIIEYIHINEGYKRERKWEINSLVLNMKQIK
jgi:hypothetical protein